MEKTITAEEANRDFSRLLHDVRDGESYVVTEDGKPVARIEPAEGSGREAAKRRLIEHLRAQPTLNLGRFSRDDAYDE